MNSKFITIDIEGDALSKYYNRQVFPEGNHFDSDTRIWCVTFSYNDGKTLTKVCKINNTRKLPRPYIKNGVECWYTTAKHEYTSVVPQRIDGHKITEYKDYVDYLKSINDVIRIFTDNGYKIYFKGYGSHDYDKELLKVNFDRNNIEDYDLSALTNFQPRTWNKTAEQVQSGGYRPNQQYMINGIRHNIEDATQLAEYIGRANY